MSDAPGGGMAKPSAADGARARRILLVTDRVPGLDIGHGIRTANVIDGLRNAGELEVALIDSSCSGAHLADSADYRIHRFRVSNPPSWSKPWRLVRFLPANTRYHRTRAIRQAIRVQLGSADWDVVWCSRARVHLLTAGVIGGPRVVDFDDLNDRLLRSKIADRTAVQGPLMSLPRNARDWLDARLWSRVQSRIAASVENVAVCSDEDRRYLTVPNCAVVPNGYPDPAPGVDHPVRDGSPPRLLFVGALTYEPNWLAVLWFVKEVLPMIRAAIGSVEFVVVGDHDGVDVSGARAGDVTFAGWVPDTTDFYRSATVAVVPLHSGGGTRLKVIEALARSVPLVSTSFGCDGHDLIAGVDLLVADDAAAFGARCCELLTDDSLRARLVEAGRERYERNLTAAHTADAVHQLAIKVASSGVAFADAGMAGESRAT